jgi:hypothetical protein
MNQKEQFSSPIARSAFPKFLGFAIADESSVRYEDGRPAMDYHISGQKVMQIKLSEDAAEISDWLDGKRLRVTHAHTIETCVQLHYIGVDQQKDPIHKAWVNASVASGNILVRYIDNDPDIEILYPDVFLTDIYIPVPVSDVSSLENILSSDYVRAFNPSQKKGILNWVSREDKRMHKEPLHIVCITCPVAMVPPLISSVKDWIYPGRMWRAFSTKHDPQASSHVEMFFGSEKDYYLNFSLIVSS